MRATKLDVDTTCPLCGGDGTPAENDPRPSCPRCGGDGTINRYRENLEGSELVLAEQYDVNGVYAVFGTTTMPETSEETGGFDGRFGDWTPEDLTTGAVSEAAQDLKDRIGNNPLGANVNASGEYDLADGPTFEAADLKGGVWPRDCPDCGTNDLCAGHIVSWLQARGTERLARQLDTVFTDLGL